MDTKAIGDTAVNAVKESINYCDTLSAYINCDDTIPSWDGDIHIFKDSSGKKKENIYGIVRTQVKGHEHDFAKDLKKEITHPIEKSDMQNYMNNSGCIYFVVYVSPDGQKKEIYYNALTPVKLKEYLEQAKNNKDKKSYKFTKFPVDKFEKQDVLLNFYNNSKKQVSFIDSELLTPEDLNGRDDIESMIAHTTSTNPLYTNSTHEKYMKFLSQNDMQFYAQLKNSQVEIPLKYSEGKPIFLFPVDCNIGINNKIYYKTIEKVIEKDKTIIKIGKSITITFDESVWQSERVQSKFKINATHSLRNSIIDVEFILSILENGYFEFDGHKFPIDITEEFSNSFNIEELKLWWIRNKELVRILNNLNVKKDIRLDELTKEDYKNINFILSAFGENNQQPLKLTNSINKGSFIRWIKIQDISLSLLFKKAENDDEFYISSSFGHVYTIVEKNEAEEYVCIVSPYCMVDRRGFATLSNINYADILPSFQRFADEDGEIMEKARTILFEMLFAYDETSNKDLLQAAQELSKWINENDEKGNTPINTINYYQVIKRKRKLEDKEIEELSKFLHKSEEDDNIKVAVYLLLDNVKLANSFLKKLTQEQQDEFKNYPIAHFLTSQ